MLICECTAAELSSCNGDFLARNAENIYHSSSPRDCSSQQIASSQAIYMSDDRQEKKIKIRILILQHPC